MLAFYSIPNKVVAFAELRYFFQNTVRGQMIAKLITILNFNFSDSISIGVADFDLKRRKSSDALIESADKCLYQAKRAGKNRVFSSLRVLEKKSAEVSVSAPV